MRFPLPRSVLALSLLAVIAVPACAQDEADFSDDTPVHHSAGPVVWCSADNPQNKEAYLSAPRRMHSTSRMAVWSLSGHFAQTVNARFGTHLVMSAPHCRVFQTAAESENARAAITAAAVRNGMTVRDPGIF